MSEHYVYTHVNPDLDAVACLWFAIKFINKKFRIRFVPGNWDGKELREGDLAVDITAGLKGQKSAFYELVEIYGDRPTKKILRHLARYIDMWDSGEIIEIYKTLATKKTVPLIKISLSAVFRGIQFRVRDDLTACLEMFGVFDDLYNISKKVEDNRNRYYRVDWRTSQVAILYNARWAATQVFEKGCKLLIFVDGNSLGILKETKFNFQLDHPILLDFVNGIEDHWTYSDPYRLSRGTRKSPMPSPSKINPHKLVDKVIQVLELV